jgi:hypothetical protein
MCYGSCVRNIGTHPTRLYSIITQKTVVYFFTMETQNVITSLLLLKLGEEYEMLLEGSG